jgi:hypothetical protein
VGVVGVAVTVRGRSWWRSRGILAAIRRWQAVSLEVKVGANLLDAVAPEIVVVTLAYFLIAIGLQFAALEPAAQPDELFYLPPHL